MICDKMNERQNCARIFFYFNVSHFFSLGLCEMFVLYTTEITKTESLIYKEKIAKPIKSIWICWNKEKNERYEYDSCKASNIISEIVCHSFEWVSCETLREYHSHILWNIQHFSIVAHFFFLLSNVFVFQFLVICIVDFVRCFFFSLSVCRVKAILFGWSVFNYGLIEVTRTHPLRQILKQTTCAIWGYFVDRSIDCVYELFVYRFENANSIESISFKLPSWFEIFVVAVATTCFSVSLNSNDVEFHNCVVAIERRTKRVRARFIPWLIKHWTL